MIDYLETMKEMNIKVNWGTVYLGWLGPGKFHRLLSFINVFDYGSSLLKNQNTEEERIIIEILSLSGDAKENDTELIKKYLSNLKDLTKYNKEVEQRKWTVVLLKELLERLDKSKAIEVLTELTSFWAKFDYPEYSPHLVQGRNNSIRPQKYYTTEFSSRMILQHKRWIADQILTFSV
jgi:hypothetical protein